MADYAGLGVLDAFDVVQIVGPPAPWNASTTIYAWWEPSAPTYRATQFPGGLEGIPLAYSLTVKPGKRIVDFFGLWALCVAGNAYRHSFNNNPLEYHGPGIVQEAYWATPTKFSVVLSAYSDPIALYLNPEARLEDEAPPPSYPDRWTSFLRAVEIKLAMPDGGTD